MRWLCIECEENFRKSSKYSMVLPTHVFLFNEASHVYAVGQNIIYRSRLITRFLLGTNCINMIISCQWRRVKLNIPKSYLAWID